LKEAGKAAVDDAAAAIEPFMTPSMETRIKRFREGQAAIQAMKESLSQVVQALVEAGMKLPITIIVDELDRCRPTYAIKVLEEIKHLFDVPGIAFLLGLHGRQLEHSVTGAYGQGFDGAAYLRRFFSRRYSLKAVSLQPLVQHLIIILAINENRLDHPSVIRRGSGRAVDLPKAELISGYLRAYGLAARDAFSVMEGLHTALALVGKNSVQIAYLIPLLISRHLGLDEPLNPANDPGWSLVFHTDYLATEMQEHSLNKFVEKIHATAKLSDAALSERINANDLYASIVTERGFRNSSDDYHLLQNYPELTRSVARFS
jgi:hypothetical protein